MGTEKSAYGKFNNCVELNIPEQNKTLAIFLPTAENAKMMAVLLRRCLALREFRIDVKYNTEQGFISAQKDGPELKSSPEASFQGLQTARESNAFGRMTVAVKRDKFYGGDITICMYFYSKMDMMIAFNLIKLGLNRTYAEITLERNSTKTHVWSKCAKEIFCDCEIAEIYNRAGATKRKEMLQCVQQCAASKEPEVKVEE